MFGAGFVGAFSPEKIDVAASALTAHAARAPTSLRPRAFGVARDTYHSLRSFAELAPGEWVVVLGATGGVGLAAVELAHLMGAKVLAAAAGKDRLEVVR